MATITISKSGTLNPALSRIDNDDATTTAYVAGDTLSVDNWATLRITSSTAANPPGTLQANSATPGTVEITNTSTTTPIVVTLSTINADLLSTGSSLIRIGGDWIQVHTGTGLAGQTINFASIGGVSIDYPPCVWVETGDVRHSLLSPGGVPGRFMPFFNCGEVADPCAINIATEFYGDQDHGPVFQYNRTTQVATFGAGGAAASSLGGAVIPSGARVLYPNIHITSTAYTSTEASRNVVAPTIGGKASFSVCAFSRNWSLGRAGGLWSAHGDTSLISVGFVGRLYQQQCVGQTLVNNIVSAPDTQNTALLYSIYINYPIGAVSVGVLWAMLKSSDASCIAIGLQQLRSAADIEALYGWVVGTAASRSSNQSIRLDAINTLTTECLRIGYIHGIGGYVYFSNSRNIHTSLVRHSDRASGIAWTASSSYACVIAGTSAGISIGELSATQNGSSPRQVLVYGSTTCRSCAIGHIEYDLRANTAVVARTFGSQCYIGSALVPNARTALTEAHYDAVKATRIAALRGNQPALTLQGPVQGTYIEWALGTLGWTNPGPGKDGEPFNCAWTSAAYDAGAIRIGPMRDDANEEHLTVVAGVEGVDWVNNQASRLYINGTGVELIYTAAYPIRSVTNFSTAVWAVVGSSPTTGAAYELSMRHPDSETWGAWYDATIAANWQTALAALSGYTSNVGFMLRLRITTSTALAGRYFNYASITCATDPAWAPAEVGFVPVTCAGFVDPSMAALYDNTVPATPVLAWRGSIAGASAELDFPYQFDGVAKPLRLVVRKAGYDEVGLDAETYQLGVSLPVSQVLRVSVNEAAAAALTGISINGPAGTVSVTSSHTLAELYAYCQWWSAQRANIIYTIPLTTVDGSLYSSTYDWTIGAGVAITGTGEMGLGAASLTVDATATSTVPWTYNGGAAAWVSVAVSGYTVGARIQLYDVSTSTEIYNGIPAAAPLSVNRVWTVDRVIRCRMARVVGLDADLLIETTGLLTSSGASILLMPVADAVYEANAIDGSTVTEFVADYPNVQIDVSDPDGVTTPQRGYAWYMNGQMSAAGIAAYHGAMTAEDAYNYRINVSVANMLCQNVSAAPCVIAGARLYRSDGSSIFAAGLGPIQHDPDKALVARIDLQQIVSDTLTALNATTIPVDVQKMNAADIIGDGTSGNPWRGVGVSP